MNVISILWQLSFISLLLFFAFQIGMSSGLSKLNKKSFVTLCVIYGVGILLLTWIFSNFTEFINTTLLDYVNILYFIMAVIMGITSLHIIKKWKANIYDKSNSLKLANIATIPCCIITLTLNIIVIAPKIGFTITKLNIYSVLLLIIIMSIVYLTTKHINSKREYPVILSNYMLIFAEYFIFIGVFLPNISTALQKTTNITISSEYMINLAIFMVILIILGIIINTRKNLLR